MKKLWQIISNLNFKSSPHSATSQKLEALDLIEDKKLIILKQESTKKITSKQSHLLDIAVQTKETSAKDANSLVFMARPFVQTTLPHRDPCANEWSRINGKTTFIIQSGISMNPDNGKLEHVGIPYGVIPRVLLIWITSEVLQRKTRRLNLGENLAEFMRKLGLNPNRGGARGDITRLKEQLRRLLRCTLSFDQVVRKGDLITNNWLNMQIAWKGSMSWINPKDYHFQSMKKEIDEIGEQSWIELSEPFFEMVKDSCVPLDHRVLREIKQSPLAIDLYTWMIHRTYSAPSVVDISSKRSFVAWYQLHGQFGSNYTRIDNFKQKLKPILRQIQALSDNLCLEEARGGLIIKKK